MKLKKPYVITVDFDVLTKKPVPDPLAFTDELCLWIQKRNPELLTLSFSASYEDSSDVSWERLARFFKNIQAGNKDRGCLAFYAGVTDFNNAIIFCTQQAQNDPRYTPVLKEEENNLKINICVFGQWKPMQSPFDFTPGEESLLIEDSSTGEKTLLQTSVAIERNYTKEGFLLRLSNKAGLGLDGWKNREFKFWKSSTISYTILWHNLNRQAFIIFINCNKRPFRFVMKPRDIKLNK